MLWSELIGKKIVAFRGFPHKESNYSRKIVTELQYILFNDKETFIRLNEQDGYDYHDCCNSARTLDLVKDKEMWKRLFNKEGYKEPDDLSSDPF